MGWIKFKKYSTCQPVLGKFDTNLPTNVFPDDCQNSTGAILKQPQINGEENPIAFFLKKVKRPSK